MNGDYCFKDEDQLMLLAPTMREFITIAIAVSLISCSTNPKNIRIISTSDKGHAITAPASEIPFPKTTDFDDDAEARAYYMAAFEDGYRNALRGRHGVICTFGRDGRRGIAREIGYMEGQMAADKFRTERDLKRALEQSGRLKESSK